MSAQAVAAWMQGLPAPQRALLDDLRARLIALLPEAQEVISYRLPGLRLGGAMIAGYGAFANHCSLFPHSGTILPGFGAEIAALGMTRTKSALHFSAARPIPPDLLARIIAARRAEAGV